MRKQQHYFNTYSLLLYFASISNVGDIVNYVVNLYLNNEEPKHLVKQHIKEIIICKYLSNLLTNSLSEKMQEAKLGSPLDGGFGFGTYFPFAFACLLSSSLSM